MRGGPSAEYDISLQTGASILSALRDKLADKYTPVDVFIDKAGTWHIDGEEVEPVFWHHHFDLAWNALHGAYGEDGKIQTFFETHGVPYTGSGALSSAIGMNKALTKKVLKDHGIKSPYWTEVTSRTVGENARDAAQTIFTSFILPAVVKPAGSGSSVGVAIVRTRDELEQALIEAAKHGDTILIEEYIKGDEATCGVIDMFRSQDLYALPVIEIKPKNGFFDFAAKYSGQADEIVPARFPEKIKKEIEELAKLVHKTLRLRHFSRTDFIIHPRRGIYVLETNTLPGMTEESLFPKALRAVGSDIHELIDHVIQITMPE